MKFRDMPTGAEFDWIDRENPSRNSFYDRCRKTGTRTYVSLDRNDLPVMRVGSINVRVFNCGDEPA